ncbi:atherin-like [Brachypodium distachyon]|uniref:atherin-like n=1 Tax=Brachypodium distachyon TaxID=15368 RepID=UPI000D0D7B5C|nr:atherin-like [Brachypodium distachyon]|eukprot:XP_024313338.1 atherin-like [Brachypodium distachyon]
MSAEATYGVGLGLGLDLNKSPPKADLQLQPTVGAPADCPAQAPEPPLQTCSAPAKSASVDPRKYSLPLAILPAPQPAGAAPALPPGLANPQVPPALSSPLQPARSGNSRQRVKKRGRPPSPTGRKGPKGRFEILSLSGSYVPIELDGVVIGRFQGDDKKQLGQAGTTETMGAMNGGSHGELRIVPN